MRLHPWHAAVPVGLLLLIPLVAFAQDQPPGKKQTSEKRAPKPRLDLYGDPLPEGAIARIGTIRFILPDDVEAVALSPDAKTLAARCDPRGGTSTLHLFDTATGRSTRSFDQDMPDLIGSPAFSPDGGTLAAVLAGLEVGT